MAMNRLRKRVGRATPHAGAGYTGDESFGHL